MNKVKMKLIFKKTHADAIIPSYAHPGDAGMDLCSICDKEILPNEVALIGTGLSVQLPENTEAQVRPKSGLALKYAITVLNTPGTVDEGYRGEIGVILINHGKETYHVTKGQKIAQLVIKPTLSVDIEEQKELSSTQRGEGGFGSTGLNK
ncbi:dUTP diphosphatase [Methylobacter sp. S3L5C]|uniref:dUTP diphosphatase n=1 Tax=Methylobacter sp. S3L5C TaxID=2839024 RepID=UPI001FADDA0F|nr:dUTP diphosphatase [Methylobacter sp. S3L5C]UOA07743.1 dUTP diphosphatase [Methylobacter sp. S3L5C]